MRDNAAVAFQELRDAIRDTSQSGSYSDSIKFQDALSSMRSYASNRQHGRPCRTRKTAYMRPRRNRRNRHV